MIYKSISGSGDTTEFNSLLRLMLIPFSLWIATSLVKYALRRVHTIRTLYVDIDYRIRDAKNALTELNSWKENFDNFGSVIPLSGSKDKGRIFESMQDDVRECLWGKEIDAVHLFYRVSEKCQERFVEVKRLGIQLERYIEFQLSEEPGTKAWLQHKGMIKSLASSIEDHRANIEAIVQKCEEIPTKIEAVDGPRYMSWNFERVARSFFWPKRYWYTLFIILPLLAAVIFAGLLGVRLQLSWQSYLSLAIFVGGYSLVVYYIKDWIDDKIYTTALQPLGKLIEYQKPKTTPKILELFNKIELFLKNLIRK